MNLHQANNTPDWSSTPENKRNFWQQIAAKTKGIGTPGNLLSFIGFYLVLFGLWVVINRSLWQGTLFVSIGRIADLLDGITAHHTGTKSPLGKAVDASLDKIGALAALAIFTTHLILPVWVAAGILFQNLITVGISVYAPWRSVLLSPSSAGKISTAGFWITIVLFVAARLTLTSHFHTWSGSIVITAYSMAIVSLMLGLIASGGYLRIVFSSPRKH